MTVFCEVPEETAGKRIARADAIITDSHDAEKVRSLLGKLSAAKASYGASRLVDALAVVVEGLDARRPGQSVVVISDLQRVSWEGSRPGEAAPAEEAQTE